MKKIVSLAAALGCAACVLAQNPLIGDQFTADPTARVFEGRVYMYPSHDIPPPEDQRQEWFTMADYHVFSSDNLVDWTDHGVIVDQATVPWVNGAGYSMWAPDCIERDGKYYFYFPAPFDPLIGRGNGIGVAISDTPYGPFVPQPRPIEGVTGIDPGLFIDRDGQAYITWAGRGLHIAKLKANMIELDSEPQPVQGLPEGGGLKEGPFLFERGGKYYYTFPWVINNTTEALVYCMGDNPMGPFEYKGVIMDEHANGCWTNHHSVVEFEGEWYLFYHRNDYSPHFDKLRSARIERLAFNPDGTIAKVTPTERGVGVSDARREIHLDRYSALSEGASIEYLQRWTNTFAGWKVMLPAASWVKYDDVRFGGDDRRVQARVLAPRGGSLMVTAGGPGGDAMEVARMDIPAGNSRWMIVEADLGAVPDGVKNLTVQNAAPPPAPQQRMTGGGQVEIDWIRFY
jgi:hypothetical protein